MGKINVKEYKNDLRQKMRKIRKDMPKQEKLIKDNKIKERICKLYQYKNAKLVIAYMSTPLEIDTYELIKAAWADGKKVAMPKCIDGTRNMDFYYINSLDDLSKQSFGIFEPDVNICKKVNDFADSICIIPAFCYDQFGYRIGYGGGYYDRFLMNYKGIKIGCIYKECIKYKIIHGRYDIPVDILVCDKYIKRIKK